MFVYSWLYRFKELLEYLLMFVNEGENFIIVVLYVGGKVREVFFYLYICRIELFGS